MGSFGSQSVELTNYSKADPSAELNHSFIDCSLLQLHEDFMKFRRFPVDEVTGI